MISRTLAVLVVGILVAFASAGDAAKQAKEKLHGSWQSTEIVSGGNKSDLEVNVKFDGDKVIVAIKGKDTINGTYSVDTSKSPATLDLNLDHDGNALTIRAI